MTETKQREGGGGFLLMISNDDDKGQDGDEKKELSEKEGEGRGAREARWQKMV